jgi:transketolase
MVERALDAADALAERGLDARVLNMATVRPLDRAAIVAAAKQTGAIVTVEEHTVYGGLGGAVAEVVSASYPVPIRMCGVPGVFAPTGSTEELFHRFGLTVEGIIDASLIVTRGRRAA